MSKNTLFLLFSTVLLPVSAFAGGDDLFSEVRPVDVFSQSVTNSAANPERITSAEQLRDLLNSAGFDSRVAGNRAVVLTKELDPWTFPVVVNLAENEQHVAIMLGLRTISDTKELTADVLLKMMSASRRRAPVVFTYSESRTRTEACVVLRNSGLTGQILRDEINRIAIAARDEATIWSAGKADSAKKSESKSDQTPNTDDADPPTTPEPAPQNADVSTSLVGRWSAAKSATEAFAIEFKADATFRLVYVNNGKQTLSSGRFEVADQKLTLNGSDGLKLSGSLTVSSAKEFRFTPAGGTELVFTKAAK